MIAGKATDSKDRPFFKDMGCFYSFVDGVVIKYHTGLQLDTRGRNLNMERLSSALLSFLGRRKMRFT
jgi:hypothetical protein